jgi:hypothetical protein
MAQSTITLQSSMDFLSASLPTNLNIGATGRAPVVSAANKVLQTILNPPFRWLWNRATTTFSAVTGQTDYVASISDYGFFEGATITQAGTSGAETYEIPESKLMFMKGTETGRPQAIAALLENTSTGNITFRVSPAPDSSLNGETITVTYQKIPPLITALTATWTPIPDRFSVIYDAGLQFYMLMQSREELDRQLVPFAAQSFAARLLAVSEGLSEQERDTFQMQWNLVSNQNAAARFKPQQGAQARQS